MRTLYRTLGFENKNMCIRRRYDTDLDLHFGYYKPVQDVYFESFSDALIFCTTVLGDWPWQIVCGSRLVARSNFLLD